jgi:hypothetical protein
MISGNKPSSSTGEAEATGVYHAICEAQYMRMLLEEIGFPQYEPTPIYCDNDSAIEFMTHGRLTQANKHWSIHLLRSKALIENKVITIRYITSEANIADIGTKQMVDNMSFQRLRDAVCPLLLPAPSPSTS